MFKTPLIIATCAFVLSAFFMGFIISRISDVDLLNYQKLIESSEPSTKKTDCFGLSRQTREGVKKQIWHENKHIVIESEESELFFFHQNNQMEVVEELGVVRCAIQEELYYLLPDGREVVQKENGELCLRGEEGSIPSGTALKPMQLIRYLEAKEACYNYNTQLFSGREVKLWKYRLEGHKMFTSFEGLAPMMSGMAQSVEFSLKSKQLDFSAYQMRATFNPKEEIL